MQKISGADIREVCEMKHPRNARIQILLMESASWPGLAVTSLPRNISHSRLSPASGIASDTDCAFLARAAIMSRFSSGWRSNRVCLRSRDDGSLPLKDSMNGMRVIDSSSLRLLSIQPRKEAQYPNFIRIHTTYRERSRP